MLCGLRWSLDALEAGTRPRFRHDGSAWDPRDPVYKKGLELGPSLPKSVLIWLKGDWAEVHHTLGMPSVSSHNCPCPYCSLRQPNLHDYYHGFGMPPLRESYSDAVRAREIHVVITTEADRARILRALHFRRGQTGFGRELFAPVRVGGTDLRPQDRLEPTAVLPDVMLIDTAPLPIRAVFWRCVRDHRGRISDQIMRVNPLFGVAPPQTLIAIDSLHTVYGGVAGRLVSCICWRVLLSNPFGLRGSPEHIMDFGIRRMAAHMALYFDEERIPHDRRIGTLTSSMIGDRMNYTVGEPHILAVQPD